jgi:hypothetical protein
LAFPNVSEKNSAKIRSNVLERELAILPADLPVASADVSRELFLSVFTVTFVPI